MNYSRINPRLVNRVMLECALAECDAAAALGDHKFETGILLIILAQQTLAVAPHRPPGQRGVSVNALAASFHRPYETVRRRVNHLMKIGLCDRDLNGVVFATDTPMAAWFLDKIHDFTLRLIEDLRNVGYPLPESQDDATREEITNGGLDFLGQLLDIGTSIHSDWTRMHLYYAIMVANARAITHDPDLSHQFAHVSAPPPDTMRQPVSTRALSRALSIPYVTIRRHLGKMLEADQIVRTSGGWLLTRDWMNEPTVLENGFQAAAKLEAMVLQFARAGFPMKTPEAHYLHGRPALLSFD